MMRYHPRKARENHGISATKLQKCQKMPKSKGSVNREVVTYENMFLLVNATTVAETAHASN